MEGREGHQPKVAAEGNVWFGRRDLEFGIVLEIGVAKSFYKTRNPS